MKVCDDPKPITVTVAGCTLSETKSFKYLGAMFNSEATCDEEVKSKLAIARPIARQRLSDLVPIWKLRTVSNKLKARLIKAVVWPIVTYGSEAWTLNKELCQNVEAFEMQCYRRAMRISYVEHVTNEKVLRRVGQDMGLLGQVKSRKLKYFSHTTTYKSLEKDIMLGIMPGKRRKGGQKKQWINDIVQWGERNLVEMVKQAENRKRLPVHGNLMINRLNDRLFKPSVTFSKKFFFLSLRFGIVL